MFGIFGGGLGVGEVVCDVATLDINPTNIASTKSAIIAFNILLMSDTPEVFTS
jgi:hypothetical protein